MSIDLKLPTPLLGGLSPATFMRDVWQKRPLLIRQAIPGVVPPVVPRELFALAERDDVESRLVIHGAESGRAPGGWQLRHGPLPRRALPPLKRAGWTLLVQGVDLHVEAAHELLQRFRWTPDARVDDLMISFASDGGGVGAHVDSYDVFLLQVHGRRRWRVGPVEDATFRPDLPVRLLEHFEPTEEWVLEPGDMLYVPPRWGHDGIAEGECMTCSIGYRTPMGTELAKELLLRLLDDVEAPEDEPHFRDPPRSGTSTPGRLPSALARFAHRAVDRVLRDRTALERALGEVMSEPKPQVWFDAGGPWQAGEGVRLDRRTRMMYDDRHVFINGESFRAAGRDARLMRTLADERRLTARESSRLSDAARDVVADWIEQGWARAVDADGVDVPAPTRDDFEGGHR
jgi:50S ribosomal protein L16 3-hydroxylase